MKSQTCPNCQRAHDVSVYVTGQRVLCGCGIRFEVRRSAIGVSGLTAAATPSALDATALRAEPPGGFAPTYVAKPVPSLEIPGYVFRELLGRGGMGEVWRAEQQSLGRMVAVKVLPPQSAKDPEFVARFAKEAAALAALSHPNIVQIIDRGMVGEHYYFVMEYVSGKSLREAMAKGPLAPHEATKVAAQICRAMESAHEHHIVHRDLKPENILLDEKGHLKVADFGLAGFRAPDVDHGLTGTAVAMGTLHYMAPEQRRDAARVDGRADLYSLGVVLYEMLTGELPIGRFKLPSERVPGIDTRLDALVSRALEPDPEQRFSSAALMGETLERLLAEASAGPSRWISSVRPAGRAPWRVPLVWGTGVLVLLASLGALGVFWRRASARITDDGHAHAKAGALPPNTDATLGVAALASEAKGATTLDVRFVPGAEPVHAHAGYWRLGDGTLRATQAGDDTGGKPLLAPRAYVGKRYFSSDQLAVEIQLSLRPLEADFPVEAGAQRFGELSFRVKDLQISVLAIPDVGMRMGWRYFRKDGRLVVGNSSADVAEGYEEEAPFPGFNKPFQVRLGLKRVVDGVEVEGQINGAVFFRRQLPGLEGQSAKIALGCRNLHCDFNSLRVRGLASKRGLGNPR